MNEIKASSKMTHPFSKPKQYISLSEIKISSKGNKNRRNKQVKGESEGDSLF